MDLWGQGLLEGGLVDGAFHGEREGNGAVFTSVAS